jgi:rfaE bifunctional protein kinase chain/domain
MPVLVVGDLMLDEYHFGHATRISPEAPVMVIRHERTAHLPGGAANVALNLKALGAVPTLIGVAGKDASGDELERCLRSSGFHSAQLIRSEGRRTTRKMRIVADHAHQVLRLDTEDVEEINGPAVTALVEAIKKAIPNSKLVVMSDYLKGVLTPEVAQAVIARASKAGVPVAVNPKPRSLHQYQGVDLISLNRHEAAEALELPNGLANENAVSAACELRSLLGAKQLLLTLGEAGMVAAGEEVFQIPAPKVEVYDTAGAGDTVIATAALGLASSGFKQEVFELAAQTAACVVRHVGVATPSAEDLAAIRELRAR